MTDGCEWNPEADRPAYDGDAHHREASAEVIVGSDGKWRLCASCSRLPRFARYRTRKPIVRRAGEAAS